MNDMKKKLDFKVLAIMGVVVFSACGSDSDLFNPEKAAAKKEAQYASAFVQRYGEIAVDQDWGFGVTPTTRVANTNSNQWKDFTEVPGSVTATEKEVVTEWFKTYRNPQSIGGDWTDFFVQHVSGSHSNMDFLVAASDDHINNFNATEGAIMLMQKVERLLLVIGLLWMVKCTIIILYNILRVLIMWDLTLKLPDRTQINKWLQMGIIVIGL